MNSKHTPGPWITTPTFSHVFRNEGEHDGVICAMPRNDSPIQWVCDPASLENSANARLIAAAPDLLEALKEVIQSVENWACACEINGEGKNNAAAVYVRNARQAIAKAEGKE